jgi:hypothetical protein
MATIWTVVERDEDGEVNPFTEAYATCAAAHAAIKEHYRSFFDEDEWEQMEVPAVAGNNTDMYVDEVTWYVTETKLP